MVSLEFNNVFVAGIFLVELVGMVGLDEVILIPGREEGGDEALVYMFDRREVVAVEICSTSDRAAHERHGCADEELGNLGMRGSQLHHKGFQIAKGTVKNHAGDTWVPIAVQQGCHCAHRAAPETNCRNKPVLA